MAVRPKVVETWAATTTAIRETFPVAAIEKKTIEITKPKMKKKEEKRKINR